MTHLRSFAIVIHYFPWRCVLAITNAPMMPECLCSVWETARRRDVPRRSVAVWRTRCCICFRHMQHPRNYPSELCRYLSSESLRDRSASSCKCVAPLMSPSKCWKSITLSVFQERLRLANGIMKLCEVGSFPAGNLCLLRRNSTLPTDCGWLKKLLGQNWVILGLQAPPTRFASCFLPIFTVIPHVCCHFLAQRI